MVLRDLVENQPVSGRLSSIFILKVQLYLSIDFLEISMGLLIQYTF